MPICAARPLLSSIACIVPDAGGGEEGKEGNGVDQTTIRATKRQRSVVTRRKINVLYTIELAAVAVLQCMFDAPASRFVFIFSSLCLSYHHGIKNMMISDTRGQLRA